MILPSKLVDSAARRHDSRWLQWQLVENLVGIHSSRAGRGGDVRVPDAEEAPPVRRGRGGGGEIGRASDGPREQRGGGGRGRGHGARERAKRQSSGVEERGDWAVAEWEEPERGIRWPLAIGRGDRSSRWCGGRSERERGRTAGAPLPRAPPIAER
jgi:hypothetical protein